jgi:hypothetical protein
MKRCTRCGRAKPLAAFYRDRASPTGHHSACKLCHRRDVAARRRRRLAEDPATFRAQRHAAQGRYSKTPKGFAAHRAAHLRWLASAKGLAAAARRKRRLVADRRRRRCTRQVERPGNGRPALRGADL